MNWRTPLILTHLVPYLLIPAVMYVFHAKRQYLDTVIYSRKLIQAGLAALILSMLFELLWHSVVQNWEYQNDEHIFNFLMYFFMVAGFLLMGLGVKRNLIWDGVTIASAIAVPIAYFAFGVKEVIWGVQLLTLVILSVRARAVLRDNRMWLFPFFAFGVNMFFIFLLFSSDNPLYHILHDILGTLLGFAVFGYLFWHNERYLQRRKAASE
jgi:hypothetical protein